MKRNIGFWEDTYTQTRVTGLPWFTGKLDPDLKKALKRLGITRGKVLDIGSGPGTQAIALQKLGFQVTGTDISKAAVEYAKRRAAKSGSDARFICDDILNTAVNKKFDVILDRGCFHVLPPAKRKRYAQNISGLLKKKGYVFIKCFSNREKMKGGPYRFSAEKIKKVFSPYFKTELIAETVYQGTLKPPPRALFIILKNKN